MQLTLRNPQASGDLKLTINLTCNTPEEQVFANVMANSKSGSRKWVKPLEAHDKVALLIGSGPSLKASLPEIERLMAAGAFAFSLNGACRFLNRNRITPDAQIIMDAQPQTIGLVGHAFEHLFASQVDPSLFKEVRSATLWHATWGNDMVDEQPGFGKLIRGRAYCLIGGGYSVGVTSLPLLYALGYRHIICFGLDSSNSADDESHAMPQSQNADDIYTVTEFRGKSYKGSLTMRAQVESFLRFARTLQQANCIVEVRGEGLLPDIWNAKWTEQEKYTELWKHEEYRQVSPGEQVVDDFLKVVTVTPSSRVVDLGAGTGRGGQRIHDLTGASVTLVDFVDGVDKANELPLLICDLTKGVPPGEYDIGFCADVLEHIPPEQVDAFIDNCVQTANVVFFQISLVDDVMGALIGQPLHLSVHDWKWWEATFLSRGCAVRVCHKSHDTAQFFVSCARRHLTFWPSTDRVSSR